MRDRHIVPELMDDPHLDHHEHQRALAGLRRINRLCGTGRQLAKSIHTAFDKNRWGEISILDLGCGSGDVALDLTVRLQKKHRVCTTGWDMSPIAIEAANRNLLAHHLHPKLAQAVSFEQRNALVETSLLQESENSQADPVSKQFDVVYCTLFMHHFTNEQSVELLRAMKRLSKGIVIVDDLRRTHLGWWLAKIGCHLLSRSPVVHFDGPQSVRAAYTVHELLRVGDEAGLKDAEVKHHWPERFLCTWNAV
jgi:2-polyprenyl-3-methyl-5-hydroxy-6-metoxy-1,4-benzoquinol methylase